jgi:hypothetical protein
LHFATADCYQQVLNRNSPIAVRLSQLIKGCMKQVMADEDDKILKRHGFQTAAFGPVSVNRRKVMSSENLNTSLDSMDFVPIWLRTFVADMLRYIEYERKALPIALICNQIKKYSNENKKEEPDKEEPKRAPKVVKKEKDFIPKPLKNPDEKPVKGAKPEPTFFYFCRQRREHFVSIIMKDKEKRTLVGTRLECETKKLASAEWKLLDPDVKENWKERAINEWETNGGREKARLEQERLERLAKSSTQSAPQPIEPVKEPNSKVQKRNPETSENDDILKDSNISFQSADAEGISAMEQRIQQLTQSLSRVGRVLDRHREESLRKRERSNPSSGDDLEIPVVLRALAHSPLSIMPDEHVVAWIWNHEDGLVRTLLNMAHKDICVSPDLNASLRVTEAKYSVLALFGSPWNDVKPLGSFPIPPMEARNQLREALLEFRTKLIEGMDSMATDIKNKRASARDIAKRKKEQARQVDKISTDSNRSKIRFAVKFVLGEMIDTVEKSFLDSSTDTREESKAETEIVEITEPWLQNYNKRFKLEKAADLLLMYARTSTFFRLVPYEPLQSSPIEVYAREVGNNVPCSVIDKKEESGHPRMNSSTERFSEAAPAVESVPDDDMSENSSKADGICEIKYKRSKSSRVCDPEDIISEVVVDYQGDYVLSQLLQWYNAGLDQKPGLPDLLGCCLLPSMSGCWTIDTTRGANSATTNRTSYRNTTRPRLLDWLKDPYKRGTPWPDELRRSFVEKDQDTTIDDASNVWLPIGSPVLDFLVTGDDFNMMEILNQLGKHCASTDDENTAGMMASIDHGRPAQAVSNWVQCENPDCQKWRKIPWHVDVDTLPEKFVCSENIWNNNSASCDAPEDEWDEEVDACVEADGTVKSKEIEQSILDSSDDKAITASASSNGCNLAEFRVGSKYFSVCRLFAN